MWNVSPSLIFPYASYPPMTVSRRSVDYLWLTKVIRYPHTYVQTEGRGMLSVKQLESLTAAHGWPESNIEQVAKQRIMAVHNHQAGAAPTPSLTT